MDWVDLKCTKRPEFVVGGYVPSDKTGRPFATIIAGQQVEGGLRFRGRVGGGFREADLHSRPGGPVAHSASFTAAPDDIAKDAE